jgi:hypothetical protein
MMPSTNPAQKFFAGLFVAGALLLTQAPAHASEEFPAALQEAAGMPCTPSCVVCHGKVPGDAGSFTARQLSRDAFLAPLPLPGSAGVPVVKSNFAAYAAKAATDANVARVVAALKDGIDPETGDSLCGPAYGCGAHVARKAPPTDFSGPLFALGAVIAGGIMRRRRRANAS